MNRRELKKESRNSLKGNYLIAITITLLYIICIIIGAILYINVPILGLILSVIIISTLSFGFLNTFLKIARGEEISISNLWEKSNMGIKYFALQFIITLFTRLWTLLLIIPGIIAHYSYQFSYDIMLDDPDIGIMDAISLSKELTYGHKMELFILTLSFIPWYIVGAFTFGLLYLYVIPYHLTTICNFYNKITNEYLEETIN